MIEIIGTLATLIAIAGVVCNNRKLRICFGLWLASNAMTALIHAHAGIWSLFGRDIIFMALAVEGLWLWRKRA